MKAYTGWRGRAEQYRKEITRLDGHMRRLEQQNAELVEALRQISEQPSEEMSAVNLQRIAEEALKTQDRSV